MGKQGGDRRAHARLKQLRRRIERWRWTRTARGPMPATLWASAVELGGELGAYRVARELGIGYGSLRERLGDDPVVEPRQRQEFVEVNTASLFVPSPAAAGGEVELSDASGVKVVIRLGAGESLDVGALLTAFRTGR